METVVVVRVEILAQSQPRLFDIIVRLDVNVLVFDGAPQSFGEDIIHTPTSAIHTYLHIACLQYVSVLTGGKVAALIGVVDLRGGSFEGLVQVFQDKVDLQAVGQRPGDDIPGEPIDDGYQIGETLIKLDVDNIRSPDLIGGFIVDPGIYTTILDVKRW